MVWLRAVNGDHENEKVQQTGNGTDTDKSAGYLLERGMKATVPGVWWCKVLVEYCFTGYVLEPVRYVVGLLAAHAIRTRKRYTIRESVLLQESSCRRLRLKNTKEGTRRNRYWLLQGSCRRCQQ